jgi:hypothetical protein
MRPYLARYGPDHLGLMINVMRKIRNGSSDDEPDLEYIGRRTTATASPIVRLAELTSAHTP